MEGKLVEILKFDKEIVSEDLIKRNWNFYIEKAEEGILLCKNQSKGELRNFLSQLNQLLRLEYKYYSRNKFKIKSGNSPIANDYIIRLEKAVGSQRNKSDYYDCFDNILTEFTWLKPKDF